MLSDAELIRHLTTEHPADLGAMRFTDDRLSSRSAWDVYHFTLHRINPQSYQHNHEEDELPSTEKIWVLTRIGDSDVVADAFTTPEAAALAEEAGQYSWGVEAVEITLHRPDLRPIYGGPTLLEALWNEMDRLMEALMTGSAAEDGGDKFRAQELAWVLAVVTNPYAPSVDSIRAEAMQRWNEPAGGSTLNQEDQ